MPIEIQLMPEEVFLTQSGMLDLPMDFETRIMPKEKFLTPKGLANFPMHFVSREARDEGKAWLWGSDEIEEFKDFQKAYPDKALIIETAATEWYNTLKKGVFDYKTLFAKAGPELYFAYAYLQLVANVPLDEIFG